MADPDFTLVKDFLGPPGSLGDKRVAPTYVDGVPIDVFARAVEQDPYQAGQRHQQGYWSTVARLPSADPVREVFEVDLAGPRLVNRIAFDLAHFPHDAVVEWSATSNGSWQALTEPGGWEITHSFEDSNPPTVAQAANASSTHPQHFGAGHWVHLEFATAPVTASRFRLVLTRPTGRRGPVDTQGHEVAYSLGVRAFTVGYEVTEESDIPETGFRTGSLTEHLPFASTRDLIGSTVSYAKRENPASNLLAGGIWRSEPQPVMNAVVPLYLDCSTPEGEPTVVDRIHIDPLVSGVSVNLYYTDEIVDGSVEDAWGYVTWTPINRDFVLRRGFMRFDPVLATYVKMEFTNLAPAPYDASAPIVRTVRLFPENLQPQGYGLESGNSGGAGALVQTQLASLLRFNDAGVYQSLTDQSPGYTPTEALYSSDPAAAERLRNLSEFYTYMAWQGGMKAPRWPEVQRHPYVETEVLHNRRVAFYVGLANVAVYRLDYSYDEDTDQYLEYFYDDLNFDSNTGWTHTLQDLVSGDQDAVLISRLLRSRTGVRGIQFATSQSPSLQLLGDDDFDSAKEGSAALLDYWSTVGEGETAATLEASNDYNTDIGTTVTVTRSGTTDTDPVTQEPHTWAGIGIKYGTWGAIEDAGLTYGDLQAEDEGISSNLGGIENKTHVSPALGARMYAAARVIARRALQEPLLLQIFDTLSSQVVAEAPAYIPANKVVEWSVPYEAGGGGVSQPRTWDQVMADFPTYDDAEAATWSQIATASGYQEVDLIVRLVQEGVPNASWNVDTLSLFEESIVWEFSNDDGVNWYAAPGIRNDPNGVLMFPDPPLQAPTTYESLEEGTWDDLTGSWDEVANTDAGLAPTRNMLRWRVSCSRPGQHVNALSIRPWYDQIGHGVASVEGVNVAGPNLALYDHYQPIAFDPRYRMWDKPIPQSWYFFYRQFVLQPHEGLQPPLGGVNTYLGYAYTVPVPV